VNTCTVCTPWTKCPHHSVPPSRAVASAKEAEPGLQERLAAHLSDLGQIEAALAKATSMARCLRNCLIAEYQDAEPEREATNVPTPTPSEVR
jgi:hypothetical protein